MPISNRAWLLIAALVLIAGAARSDGLGNQGILGQDLFGGIGGSQQQVAPPVSGALALEDGTSILLLEDGASNLCLEGGC